MGAFSFGISEVILQALVLLLLLLLALGAWKLWKLLMVAFKG